MIIIKMYMNKWQLHIGDETWEFDEREDMEETLKILIDFKDRYGRIRC